LATFEELIFGAPYAADLATFEEPLPPFKGVMMKVDPMADKVFALLVLSSFCCTDVLFVGFPVALATFPGCFRNVLILFLRFWILVRH
jgi:hypothetical protein